MIGWPVAPDNEGDKKQNQLLKDTGNNQMMRSC